MHVTNLAIFIGYQTYELLISFGIDFRTFTIIPQGKV